jgi:hypothetical protein
MKNFVFRQYGWITVVLIIAGVVVLRIARPERFLELLLTLVGGTFSFVFLSNGKPSRNCDSSRISLPSSIADTTTLTRVSIVSRQEIPRRI